VTLAVTSIDALVMARSQFHHSANYRSLVAHGVATLVTDETAKRDAMTALVEKVGPGRSTHTRPPTARELAATAVLAMPLREVSVKRRVGGVGDDEADLALPYWAGVVPLRVTHGYGETAPDVRVPAPDYVRTRPAWLEQPSLRGTHVVLSALRASDAADLLPIYMDEEVARHLTVPRPRDIAGATAMIEIALAKYAAEQQVPWIIRDVETGEAIGTTSYYGFSAANQTIAIGHTQVARARWRTAVNTEAKLLLMTRAFETLRLGRIEWHTDIRNERSQAAIARLGATREGVLRRHKRRADGTWRDSVQFAMTVDEWPAARDRLVARLAAGHNDAHAGHH
jgi:RimJ/RimL family protein N-acetyltransferase